jgi:predicted cupin superfamily sugar epimerase
MNPRAAALIEELGLKPHPEGGYYREIYRSSEEVQPCDDRPRRAALTSIYFLLVAGQRSQWHRVRSDEVWHFYEGDALEVVWTADGEESETAVLSSGVAGARPVCVVPAGHWQAARPLGEYALVGCTVAPGFDFEDFEMGRDTITESEPRSSQSS